MAYEQTFAMFKPGVLERRLLGEVIGRIEKKGLHIKALKMMKIPSELCRKHYAEHEGKSFFESLLKYMTSAPVIAMVIGGEDAVTQLRMLCGNTNPNKASAGTIRGDYAAIAQRNIIHSADSLQSAKREIQLFFRTEEIMEYSDGNEHWIR